MTSNQIILTLLIIAFGTLLTRFIPFIVFPPHKQPPKFISYLSKTLPAAVISLLVVYAFKDTIVVAFPYGLPEIFATIFLVLIHIFKRNTMITIASSTIFYMILVQFIFV